MNLTPYQPTQIGPSLEWYLCPVCRNRSNLRWIDETGKITVLGCNAVCAAKMIKLTSNRILSDLGRGLGVNCRRLPPGLSRSEAAAIVRRLAAAPHV